MIEYGIIKADIAAITDASVQYLRDADLGLILRSGKSQNLVPAKGSIATMELIATANQGGGYSSGPDQQPDGVMTDNNSVLSLANSARYPGTASVTFSATGGTGSGATFTGTTIYRIGHLVANLPLSFGSATTTPTTTADGSTAGIAGTASNGALANFIVKARGNTITEVIVEAKTPAGADGQGTGYIIGEPVIISKAAMDADGSLGVVSGPITVFPTIDHVTQGAQFIKVLNGGSGYTVGDTLSLTQISPAQKGTPIGDSTGELATVDVKTLSPALNTPGNNKTYPDAIRNGGAGAQVINILDMEGTLVSLGTLQPGELIPVSFTQVEGTTPATVGTVQIFYS